MEKNISTHQQSLKTKFSNDISRLEQRLSINLNYQNIQQYDHLSEILQQFPLLLECDMRHRNS